MCENEDKKQQLRDKVEQHQLDVDANRIGCAWPTALVDFEKEFGLDIDSFATAIKLTMKRTYLEGFKAGRRAFYENKQLN